MRHLISLFDINQLELNTILSLSQQVKEKFTRGERPAWLGRQVLALLFEKPSLRTRVSFEAGMTQLGGSAIFLGQEVGWKSRESTADFIRVLSEYVDFVVCRAKTHATVLELASYDCVPIINGLTDQYHPCQAMADMLTMMEVVGATNGKQVTFVGDGNNVARSLAICCAMVGMRFRLLGPEGYFMPEEDLAQIRDRYPQADIIQCSQHAEGLADADFVYTDVWASMGQEAETDRRRRDFAAYQVNRELLSQARAECKVLHCLPAKRGEEITDEVLDSDRSLVVRQAGNRMHAQKGLLLWLALQHARLTPDDLISEGIRIPAEVV